MSMQMPPQPQYAVSDDDKKRQTLISNAWKAYHGELKPPLKQLPNQPDDNVLSNRCQPIIDRGVDFLFGKPLGIACEEGTAKNVIDFIDKTWGKNESRLPLLQKLAMNGAASGQAFLRIVPSRDSKSFRLVVIDPATVFVQTAPQDCETVLLYCIEYSVAEPVNGKITPVFYHEEILRVDPDGNSSHDMPDTDDSWVIQHWTRIGERGPWTMVGDPIAWPYEFSPLFSGQNLPNPNSFWGVADITPDLIAMNNALNLVLSNTNRVNKLYGQPVLFATGIAESNIEIQPGRIIGLPTPESKIQSVAIVSDLVSALAFAADLRSDMDEQSSVPAVVLGRMDVLPKGQISGVTMELMFMPISQKTEKKRCLYGDLILNVTTALLTLAGFSADTGLSLQWQSPLPDDDLASVQAALAKQQLGVSNGTLIQELGYDPDQEVDKNNAETTKKLAAFDQGTGVPPVSPQPPADPSTAPTSHMTAQPVPMMAGMH